MGRSTRKMQRAAMADSRKTQKKMMRRAVKDAVIKRALKDKARRLVAQSMKKGEPSETGEQVRARLKAAMKKDPVEEPGEEDQRYNEPMAIEGDNPAPGVEREKTDPADQQLPESIDEIDGSIAVDKPVDPETT